MNINASTIIGVVGLGYVGLPLATLFATRYSVVGFDCSRRRVDEINRAADSTREVPAAQLREALATRLRCTCDPTALRQCDVIIVAVPTPVDSGMHPDLSPVLSASRTVGTMMRPGTIVVFESTVAPGTTEDVCVPVLEEASSMRLNADFYVGYSPERINPGDHVHNVRTTRKIVSGSTPEVAERLDSLYSTVIEAGTYRAPSIRVAEAAKIIENTQRDVNIAFINEVTRIFNAMHIDTDQVIEAASTKWNFATYRPGLVGGHCIGVDPYYLIHQAQQVGIRPGLLTAARRTNEGMSVYLAERTIDALESRAVEPTRASILLLGFAFKPDCPDTRNTKAYDVYRSLRAVTPSVTVFDPVVNPADVMREYDGLTVITNFESLRRLGPFDAIVRCTDHTLFSQLPIASLRRDSSAADVRLVSPEISAPKVELPQFDGSADDTAESDTHPIFRKINKIFKS